MFTSFQFVLVITSQGRFGINCPSAFLKIWNCHRKRRAISKFSIFRAISKSREWFIPKITRIKYLISGKSDQTNKHFVLKLISFNGGQLQICKWTVIKQCEFRKLTPLKVQCRLLSITWLLTLMAGVYCITVTSFLWLSKPFRLLSP